MSGHLAWSILSHSKYFFRLRIALLVGRILGFSKGHLLFAQARLKFANRLVGLSKPVGETGHDLFQIVGGRIKNWIEGTIGDLDQLAVSEGNGVRAPILFIEKSEFAHNLIRSDLGDFDMAVFNGFADGNPPDFYKKK